MNPEELKAAVAELRQIVARIQAGKLYTEGSRADIDLVNFGVRHLPAILDALEFGREAALTDHAEIQHLTAALANRDKQIADMDAELEAHATDRVNQRAEVARLTAELVNRDSQIEDMDAGLGTEALRAEVEKVKAALAEANGKLAELKQVTIEDRSFGEIVETLFYAPLRAAEQQIASLTQERRLMGLDEHPITICPECNGTGIPKPPKQPQCCPIGHAKECACLLCQWRRSAYKKDAELLCESNYRYAEKARADTAESLLNAAATGKTAAEHRLSAVCEQRDAENCKVSGLMTRWHEEIARRERLETLMLELWDSYKLDGNGEPATFGRPNIANAVSRCRAVVAAIRAAGEGKS